MCYCCNITIILHNCYYVFLSGHYTSRPKLFTQFLYIMLLYIILFLFCLINLDLIKSLKKMNKNTGKLSIIIYIIIRMSYPWIRYAYALPTFSQIKQWYSNWIHIIIQRSESLHTLIFTLDFPFYSNSDFWNF